MQPREDIMVEDPIDPSTSPKALSEGAAMLSGKPPTDDGAHAAEPHATDTTATESASAAAATMSVESNAMAVDPRIDAVEKAESCRDSGQGSPDSHKEEPPPGSNGDPALSRDKTEPADEAMQTDAPADGANSAVPTAAGAGAASTDDGLGALDFLLDWSLNHEETSPRHSPPPQSGGKDGAAAAAACTAAGAAASTHQRMERVASTAHDRLHATQIAAENRLAAARAQLARQQTLTTLWLSARTSNPAELWHVPESGLRSDELATAARRLKARTAGLLHHRKRSRNGRAARHAAREVQRMVESSTEAADPDATDASSCESSESEAEIDPTRPAQPPRDRKKRRRVQSVWDRDRAEVGWRWNWLDLRLRVIKQGIQEYEKLEAKLAKEKQPLPVVADTSEGEGEASPEPSCARARPLAPTFARRRLVQDRVNVPPSSQIRPVSAPLVHSDRNAIRARSALLDRGFHVVLSLPSDAPHSVIQKARAHRRMLRQQALQRQKHMQQVMREGRGSVSGQRPGTSQYRHRSDDAAGAQSSGKGGRRRSSHSSRISVSVYPVEDADPGTPHGGARSSVALSPNASISRNDSLLARRKRKENSLIDDVVMPALTPARFEPLLVKEILTPSWRRSGSLTPSSADSTSMPSEPTFSPALAATQEGHEEDLLDATIVARHAPCELKERQRALGIVSETGQRSSVASGDARPRDHSKGPMVRIIENRSLSVQPHPGYSARTFPLTGRDLADVNAELPPPPEDFPRFAELGGATASSADSPSNDSSGEVESKPIKLVFKIRPTADADT
eukprot:m.444506 g.444506  ORF g.444506 m.444506 type:complete len:796 (+) comp19108_c0_seq1:246-2633(+)